MPTDTINVVSPEQNKFEPKLWPISVRDKWGFIDVDGNVRIAPEYAHASTFSNGLALVSVHGTTDTDRVFKRKYDGFIDETGRFAIPAEFPDFYTQREDYDSYAYGDFCDGVAVVRDASSSFGLCGLIDSSGKLTASMKYASLGDYFSEGLCSFEIDEDGRNSECGFMDYHGKVVISIPDLIYDSGFSNGRAATHARDDEGDYTLLIDRAGRHVVERGRYSSISRMAGGLAKVEKNGEVGLIDRNGREVVKLGDFEQIAEPEPGSMYLAEKAGSFYAIGATGEAIRLPDFGAEPYWFCDDLLRLYAEDKFGFAQPDGKMVVEVAYDDLSFFKGKLAKFRNGNEHGYLNRFGQVVWSTQNWERRRRS